MVSSIPIQCKWFSHRSIWPTVGCTIRYYLSDFQPNQILTWNNFLVGGLAWIETHPWPSQNIPHFVAPQAPSDELSSAEQVLAGEKALWDNPINIEWPTLCILQGSFSRVWVVKGVMAMKGYLRFPEHQIQFSVKPLFWWGGSYPSARHTVSTFYVLPTGWSWAFILFYCLCYIRKYCLWKTQLWLGLNLELPQ